MGELGLTHNAEPWFLRFLCWCIIVSGWAREQCSTRRSGEKKRIVGQKRVSSLTRYPLTPEERCALQQCVPRWMNPLHRWADRLFRFVWRAVMRARSISHSREKSAREEERMGSVLRYERPDHCRHDGISLPREISGRIAPIRDGRLTSTNDVTLNATALVVIYRWTWKGFDQ